MTYELVAIFDAYTARNAVEVRGDACPWCLAAMPHAHELGTLLITFPNGIPPRAVTLGSTEEVNVWS